MVIKQMNISLMYKKITLKFIAPLLFLFPFAVHAEIIDMKGWSVDTRNLSSENYLPMIQLTRTMDNIINVYTTEAKRKTVKGKCILMFMKAEDLRNPIDVVVLKNKTVMVYLPSDSRSWKNDYKVLGKLIELNIMSKYNLVPDENSSTFPHWISTAIARKIIRKIDIVSLPGLYTYPRMRLFAMNNILAENSLWTIFNAPLYQEDGSLFEIYAEACEILLDACYSISNADENLITQTIMLYLNKKSTEEEAFMMNVGTVILSSKIFDFIKSEGLPEKTILSKWYNNQVQVASMRHLIPAGDSYSGKLFEQALVVSYHVKDNEKTEIKSGNISMIESDFNIIEDKNLLFSDIIKDLTAVKNKIPFAFHQSISKIIEAVSLLKANKPEGFADKVKEARQDFAKVLTGRKAMNEYMIEMEKKFLPPVIKYNNQLLIIEEEQDRRRLAAPLIEIYLDKLEKMKLD